MDLVEGELVVGNEVDFPSLEESLDINGDSVSDVRTRQTIYASLPAGL